MDPSLIQTLTGTTQPSEAKNKRAEAGDGDVFSKALEDATGKSSTSGKAGQNLIDDKTDSKTAEKKEEKKKLARQENEEFQKATGQVTDKGTPAYMRKLMHTNPDIMTMAEKQAARVGEYSLDAQLKLGQQQHAGAQAPTGAAAKLASGLPPQGVSHGSSKPGAEKVEDAKEKLIASKDHKPEDKETFDKLVKEAPSEKGKVNLEKLLNQEAAKEAQGPSQAQRIEKAQERQGVLNQILSNIEVRNLASKTEMQITLNPEYLGELKMNLTHTADGVRADFTTTSKATRQLLQEGEEDLRSQAKDKGVRMGAMSFRLADDLA